MSIAEILTETESRYKAARESARLTLTKAAGGGGIAGVYSGGVDHFGGGVFDREMASAQKQYNAAKSGLPYTAIRPVAFKIADQAVRVGAKQAVAGNGKAGGGGSNGNGSASGNGKPGKIRTKSSSLPSLLPPAPPFIRKQIAEGMEQIDNHAALALFEQPNPFMVGWSHMYCTAMSIKATGKAYWWIRRKTQAEVEQEARENPSSPASLPISLWYLPATWVRPVHEEGRPFVGWRVTPPGKVEDPNEPPIPFTDICPFWFPDPADPTSAMSPLQSQARAINTDDEIQKAQYASMVNGMKPGMVLVGGRLDPPPGMTGQGPKVTFTPEQRQQIVSACRMAYAGAMHYGDPIILDSLIEDVYPYTRTPAELDFMGGSQLTKDRILQGLGTNPIITGQVEGANRASSYVAQENFYANSVNPIITLMSQVMTAWLSPFFSAGSEKLYLWIEEAKAHDADLELQKVGVLAQHRSLKKNELREWGGFPPLDGPEGEEMTGMEEEIINPPLPAGAVGATRPKPAGGGGGGGKKPKKR